MVIIKRLLIPFFVLITSFNLNAQSRAGKIEITKVFGGYKYQLHGISLTRGQLSEVLEKDEKAYTIMKKANANNAAATIFGGAGGLLIGFPIGAFIAGKKFSWELAGVGAAFALISLPLDLGDKKHTIAAVEAYNENLTSYQHKKLWPFCSIGITPVGFGLVVKF